MNEVVIVGAARTPVGTFGGSFADVPAIRLGAALHMTVVRVNLLFDLYPGELKKGGGPSWRGIIAAGIGF